MNEQPRKWYSDIVLLHCVGMLMILFAHIAHANGYMNVGELLTTGVPLFLFVSGFLVGVKPVLLRFIIMLHWGLGMVVIQQ